MMRGPRPLSTGQSTANNTTPSPNPNPFKAATFVTCGTLIG